MERDATENASTITSEDVNLNVTAGNIIRNLNVPCNHSKLNGYFSKGITALVFHREISVVNLVYILNRCSSLQTIHLDNVILNYSPGTERQSTKVSKREITLKHLKQIKISFIHQNEGISKSKPASLHSDTRCLFKFIEMIMKFGSLEEVDIICSVDQLLTIPLPAAFVPNYTFQPADSLVEFLYNNRCTLRQLTMGPTENEKLFITFPLPDQVDDVGTVDRPFDHTFRKMTDFVNRGHTEFEQLITAHDHPLPQWWTCMLDCQTTLKHLSLTLMDPEVLAAALAAAERCCDTLTVLHLRIIGKDMNINLEAINRCDKITTMSLTVHECHIQVSNFVLLPENITIFKISGCVCEKLCDVLVKSLSNVKELTVCLSKFDYPEVTTFSIVNWPVFENLLDFHNLEFFVVEAEHLSLDWDEIYEWSKSVDWCLRITHNTLEEIARDEIHMQILPAMTLQQADSVDSGIGLGSWCLC